MVMLLMIVCRFPSPLPSNELRKKVNKITAVLNEKCQIDVKDTFFPPFL